LALSDYKFFHAGQKKLKHSKMAEKKYFANTCPKCGVYWNIVIHMWLFPTINYCPKERRKL
jgi:hypothetical protein